MAKLINNTNRVIAVDKFMLVPGQAVQVKDVKSLTSKYPRLAELIETGSITDNESKATKETNAEVSTEDEDRTLNRRKRG